MNTLKASMKVIKQGTLWFKNKIVARRFIRNVSVLTIANFAGSILSFTQGVLVARWLGPELYGLAALVMGYPALLYTFFDARSSQASIKYLSEFHVMGQKDYALSMCKLGYMIDFAIASLAFLVVLITSRWAAKHIVHHFEFIELIVIYAAAFVPRATVGTSKAAMASLGKFFTIAKIEFVIIVIRTGLVIGLVLAGFQVTGVIWGNAVSMVAASLLYGGAAFVLIQRTWGMSWLKGNWQILKGRYREIFRFLAFNDLSALLGMIPKQLDVLLLGYFRNSIEAGYYKLAKNLASIVGYLVGPLQSVTYPELSRLWGSGNREAVWQKARRLALQIGMPFGIIVSLCTILVPVILPLLLGQEYNPAFLTTQLLLIGSAVWLSFFWLRPIYMAQMQIYKWTAGICVYSIGYILLSALTIQRWGHIGMAFSLSFVTSIFHVYMALNLYAKRRYSRTTI